MGWKETLRGLRGSSELWPWLVALCAVVGSLGMRASLISVPISQELACDDCLVRVQLIEDFPFFSLLLVIYAFSRMLDQRPLVVLCRLLVLLGLVFYAIDIAIYRNFFVRFDIRDMLVYGEQFRIIWRQAAQTVGAPALYAFVLGAVAAVCFCVLIEPARSARAKRPLLVALALMVVSYGIRIHSAHQASTIWAVRNYVAHNMADGATTPYSSRTLSEIAKTVRSGRPHCLAGSGRRPDVVVLIAESWSPYHSRLFSGLRDWTPRLDHWARQSRYFPNFYAGGSNTTAGLVSLLLGRSVYAPMVSRLQLDSFEGAWQAETSLPKVLDGSGYRTVFMTNGNLAFSRKGEWLRSIGFSEIHGHDSPEYEGIARLAFDAPPDDHLYRKALAALARPSDAPRLLVLENVSTHHPYTHPYTLETSERRVFQYMDQTMDEFIGRLHGTGFLQDNILVVVSDHRAMTLVSGAEIRKFGVSAVARIPAFVVSGLVPPGRDDTPLHQADLLPSLAALVSQGVCTSRKAGDLFGFTKAEERCLYHAPQSDWDTIHAYCGKTQAVIRLNGDDSRIESLDGPQPKENILLGAAIRRSSNEFTDILIPPNAGPLLSRLGHGLPDLTRWLASPPRASRVEVGFSVPKSRHYQCNIEFINGQTVGKDILQIDPFSDLTVSGWVSDPAGKTDAPDARLLVMDASGQHRWLMPAPVRTARRDVAKARNEPWLSRSGFMTEIPREVLGTGHYELMMIYGQGEERAACGKALLALPDVNGVFPPVPRVTESVNGEPRGSDPRLLRVYPVGDDFVIPASRHYECNIEFINGATAENATLDLDSGLDATVTGWASDPDGRSIAPDTRLLMVALDGKPKWWIPVALRSPRPDVVKARKAPWLANSGFTAYIPPKVMKPGKYELMLVYGKGENTRACGHASLALSGK